MLSLQSSVTPAHGGGAELPSYQRLADDLDEPRLPTQDEPHAEARFAAILAAIPDAVVIVDGRGTIARVNPAVERRFGHASRDLVGCGVEVLLSPADRARFCALFKRHVASPCPARQGTAVVLTAQHRDSSTFPVEVLWSGAWFEGEPRLSLIFRDISARRDLEAKLQRAQRMSAVGLLAGGAAHDFNNLLTAILGCASALEADLGPKHESWEDVALILETARRASILTRKLLASSHGPCVEPTRVDPSALIRGAEALLARLAGEDVALELRLAPHPLFVWVDPGQLEQVLMNLVVNARDAMPRGGRLVIETSPVLPGGASARAHASRAGLHVRLAVTDTGVGMSPEVCARIFEPFFTTKLEGAGTGLGLATSSDIVRQAGGRMRVRSELGRGSTFEVLLPCATAEADDTPEASL